MDETELKETLSRIEEQQKQLADTITKMHAPTKRRDFWDKMAALSPIISGAMIASGALVATYSFNEQQIKLQEAQTIEKFIPHLMGNDSSKRMAILCLRTLVNTDIAAKCAAMIPSAGTVSALKTIANTGDSREKAIASQALSKTLSELDAQQKQDVPGSAQEKHDTQELKNAMESFQVEDTEAVHQTDQPGKNASESIDRAEPKDKSDSTSEHADVRDRSQNKDGKPEVHEKAEPRDKPQPREKSELKDKSQPKERSEARAELRGKTETEADNASTSI